MLRIIALSFSLSLVSLGAHAVTVLRPPRPVSCAKVMRAGDKEVSALDLYLSEISLKERFTYEQIRDSHENIVALERSALAAFVSAAQTDPSFFKTVSRKWFNSFVQAPPRTLFKDKKGGNKDDEEEDAGEGDETSIAANQKYRSKIRLPWSDPAGFVTWFAGALEKRQLLFHSEVARAFQIALDTLPESGAKQSAEWVALFQHTLQEIVIHRNNIVQGNLGLAVSEAKKFAGTNPKHLSDYIEAGNEGLLVAADQFFPEKGFKFSTYAMPWISNHIRRAAEKVRDVRLPDYLQDRIRAFQDIRQELSTKLGRVPTSQELAKALEISVDDVEKLRTAELKTKSVFIDTPGYQFNVADENSDPDAALIDRLSNEKIRGLLAKAFSKLKKDERSLLTSYFGLKTDVPKSNQELGNEMGLSRETVRKRVVAALAHLKAILAGIAPGLENEI